jgi:hypothetical protein
MCECGQDQKRKKRTSVTTDKSYFTIHTLQGPSGQIRSAWDGSDTLGQALVRSSTAPCIDFFNFNFEKEANT